MFFFQNEYVKFSLINMHSYPQKSWCGIHNRSLLVKATNKFYAKFTIDKGKNIKRTQVNKVSIYSSKLSIKTTN